MKVGSEVKVIAGPYKGMVGVVQGNIQGINLVLGYMDDKGRPRTITVEAKQVEQND